eukprot:2008450-Rhodomonas_salina.2
MEREQALAKRMLQVLDCPSSYAYEIVGTTHLLYRLCLPIHAYVLFIPPMPRLGLSPVPIQYAPWTSLPSHLRLSPIPISHLYFLCSRYYEHVLSSVPRSCAYRLYSRQYEPALSPMTIS